MSDRFCLSYRTKYQNGEIYPTIGRCGICFFRRGVFPARRFFTRARTCMWAYARPHTPVQRMRIYYWREKNEISAVGVLWLFCGTFSSGELHKKQNCGIFGGKQCRSLQNPVKNVKFGLKRLRNGFLRRWKNADSSERTVKRRKPAKKREKRKKRKKIKKF